MVSPVLEEGQWNAPSESLRFAPVGDGTLGDPLPQVPCGHLGLFKIGPLRGLGQMPARLSEKLHAPISGRVRLT